MTSILINHNSKNKNQDAMYQNEGNAIEIEITKPHDKANAHELL